MDDPLVFETLLSMNSPREKKPQESLYDIMSRVIASARERAYVFEPQDLAIIMRPNQFHQYSIDLINSKDDFGRSYTGLHLYYTAKNEGNDESQYKIQWQKIFHDIKKGAYLNLRSNNQDWSNYGSLRFVGNEYALKMNGGSELFFETAKDFIAWIKENPRRIGVGGTSYTWD
jgi:hypothetical protein